MKLRIWVRKSRTRGIVEGSGVVRRVRVVVKVKVNGGELGLKRHWLHCLMFMNNAGTGVYSAPYKRSEQYNRHIVSRFNCFDIHLLRLL